MWMCVNPVYPVYQYMKIWICLNIGTYLIFFSPNFETYLYHPISTYVLYVDANVKAPLPLTTLGFDGFSQSFREVKTVKTATASWDFLTGKHHSIHLGTFFGQMGTNSNGKSRFIGIPHPKIQTSW